MLGVSAATWCALFAIPHAYWALGGRGGLGQDAVHADRAFEQPWFAAYNALVILACGVGACVATAAATSSVLVPAGCRRAATAVCRLAAAALLVRGGVGLVGLLWTSTQGRPLPPPALFWVEPAFVIGGLLWWRFAGALGPSVLRSRPRAADG